MPAPTPSAACGRILSPADLYFLEPVSRLCVLSPFDPAWREREREALQRVHVPCKPDAEACAGALTENLARLSAPIAERVEAASCALAAGTCASDEELRVYRGAALYAMFAVFGARLQEIAVRDEVAVPFWPDFSRMYRAFLGHAGIDVPPPERLLELFSQARRLWHFASTMIVGGSPSAEAARLGLWQAGMTGRPCLYARGLYQRWDETPVLITGETGTGKELAATVLARSRFISFNAEKRQFERKCSEDFLATNLSEGPADLVAATLFGYKRGAYTGALADSPGLFGLSRPYAVLFLDEIGEISLRLQVQLLRPLANRAYVTLGDPVPRPFPGRLLFGTHRDLDAMCAAGEFRLDLLQRMRGILVQMPPLRQVLAEDPAQLATYVRAFVARMGTPPAQVDEETERIVSVLEATKAAHAWPGNFRELFYETQRCFAGTLLPAAPGATPPRPAAPDQDAPKSACPSSRGLLGWRAKAGEVHTEEIVVEHVTWIYFTTGENARATARITGLDRRTAMKKVDHALLEHWKNGGR